MDVSKLNDGSRIVPLSLEEIELVSGGKSVVPPINQVCHAIDSFCRNGVFPSMPLEIYSSCLTTAQWATINGGGRFHYADGLISVMRADGSQIEIEVIEE